MRRPPCAFPESLKDVRIKQRARGFARCEGGMLAYFFVGGRLAELWQGFDQLLFGIVTSLNSSTRSSVRESSIITTVFRAHAANGFSEKIEGTYRGSKPPGT